MANDQMPDELPTDQWLEELFASVDQPGDSPAPASVESAGSGETAQPPVQSSGSLRLLLSAKNRFREKS